MKNALLVTIAFFLFPCLCFAGALDISSIGLGARTIAMGKAQAVARDLPSVFINPANAAGISKYDITSMYTNLTEDLNFSLFGMSFPFNEGVNGTFCFSYLSSGLGGIQSTTLDAFGRTVPTSTFDYQSKLMTFSFGKELSKYLAAGASLKMFSKNFGGIAGGNGSGMDMDLGMIFYPRDNLMFGLSAQNILPTDWGNMQWGTGHKEDIPINLKLGGSFTPRENILVLSDYDSILGTIHAGGEYWLKKYLALRAGAEKLPNALNFSLGVGLKYAGLKFDYAYYLDTTVNEMSAHYFSLEYELPYSSFEFPAFMQAQSENVQQ